MISVTDLRAGTTYREGNDLLQVISYEHIKMGRGSANIKVKVRNLKTGSTIEKGYMNGANVDNIRLDNQEMQFLYKDSENAAFMDPRTFEQKEVPLVNIPGHEFLIEGENYTLQFFENVALGIMLPPKITMKIADTPPGVKGNSASNVYKDATLENGMNIRVPLFIEIGDMVVVDTRDKSYTKRA